MGVLQKNEVIDFNQSKKNKNTIHMLKTPTYL